MATPNGSSDQFVIVEHPEREKKKPVRDLGAAHAKLLVSIRMDMKEQRYEEARVTLQLALSLNRSDPVCRALLGRCKAEIKPSCEEAVMICEGAVEALRTPETLFQLGRVYLLNGRRGDAVKAFEEGLALNPTYAPIAREFERIGKRHRSLVPFLSRDNFLNVRLGKLLAKSGLR